MINERLLEIHDEIDLLIQDLLMPIRTSKTIEKTRFDKLYCLLDELIVILRTEENVPVKLVGKLFFIYMSMNGEAEHVKYPDPLFLELGKVEDYLNKIFRGK